MTVIDDRDMMGAESSELSEAGARDYFELLKPRVMSLVVFTAFAGLVLAPGEINPILGLIAILCIAVGAGASGALNMHVPRSDRAHGGKRRPRVSGNNE